MQNEEGSSLSRKELQTYLKNRGLPATGTTAVLRAAYNTNRAGAGGVAARVPTSPPDQKPAASKKKSPSTPKKEKRLRKFRNTCSQQTRARIHRAKTQRLYLVERQQSDNVLECDFVVLGSTGNVYTVHIGCLVTCTCPDHNKGHLCKHILFVLIKVMGLNADSYLIYQAAFLKSELEEMFECMNRRRVGGVAAAAGVLANERVRSTYHASLDGTAVEEDAGVHRKSLEQDSDCPICFDSLIGSSKLTFCRAACGTNFHADCIQRWLGQYSANPTCPNCRQPWQSSSAPSSPTKEGYTNLGKLAGLPSERDTSTYSSWSPYGGYKRRRRWY